MNKRQKRVLRDFTTVIVITTIAVVAMINFKDWIKRSEATRAMKQLGQIVLQYRKEYSSVPPEAYVNRIKENLEGHARLGNLQYRALWIDLGSPADEILAYTEEKYHSLLIDSGFIVLRLDGSVEWMNKQDFEKALPEQQRQMETEMLHK